MRFARWKAATALVAAGMLVGSVAGYAVTSSADTAAMQMAPGSAQAVHCQGPQLRTAGQSATDLMLTCDPNPVTTTTEPPTTQPPETTTTTAPPVTTTQPPPPAPTGCRFDSAPGTTAAFCDTFDAPADTPGRSPALSSVWGSSRLLGYTNFGQGQLNATEPTVLNKCGTNVNVQPPNDIAVCNGQLVEAQSDQHNVTALAMYPKQPFDIAGRTGTISFDVSNDSHGIHRAWPEIWYTDTPQPAPFTHFDSEQTVPKNGIGVRFAAACSLDGGLASCQGRYPGAPTGPWVTVDSADIVTNFVSNDPAFGPTPSNLNVQVLDAVKASSGPGDNNHFEMRLSANQIDVYGTDAGTVAPLRHLAVISNFTMPLTRGLVWAEDVHYNGDKDGPDQGTHTFSWDNIGFDGPRLPRDVALDVPDANVPTPNNAPEINEGWNVPTNGTSVALTVPGVTSSDISGASAGAALLFNYYVYNPVTITYRINGGAWQSLPWPFPSCSFPCAYKTIAAPVNLGDVVTGNNTVEFKSTDQTSVSNVDLVFKGAGG